MTEIFARAITVVLVDAHPIFREGLARAIEDKRDLVVVGQFGSAAEALAETTKAARPDVVLVDLDTPDADGIALVCALRAQLPRSGLLVLTGDDNELRLAEALRAGAHGYVVKTARIEEIIAGIRHVAAGGAPLSALIAGVVLRAMRNPVAPEGSRGEESLTSRECQILRLLGAGMPSLPT